MSRSALCDTKMRNFLLWLVLGLLAVVHSTPVDTVTHIAEEDVIREAVTDGFLVDHPNFPSFTTESPKTNTSVQPSQQPGSTTQTSHQHGLDMVEGSAAGEVNDGFTMTTTQSVSWVQSSTSGSDQSVASRTTYSAPTTSNILTALSDSGSGDGDVTSIGEFTTTTSSATSGTSLATTSSMTTPVYDVPSQKFIEIPELTGESYSGSGSGSGLLEDVISVQTSQNNYAPIAKVRVTDTPLPAGHTTPDWIIILGFIVGVAALVLLCIAIATRDKWNAPKYVAQPAAPAQSAANTNASNQQRELEMETFLNKEMPKENGKAGEYTVIPLDELPENYSSH